MRIVKMILAAVLLTGSAAAADAKGQANANNFAQASTSSSVRAGDSIPGRNKRHSDHHKGPPVVPVCSTDKSSCNGTVSPQ